MKKEIGISLLNNSQEIEKLLEDILQVSPSKIQSWNHEKKLIAELLNKYFSEYDLQEFINTRKIRKFELISDFDKLINNLFFAFEHKFIFSIINYGIKFIDMLKEHNLIYIGIYSSDDLQKQDFYFEIRNNPNYKLFIEQLHDTKFNYFYINMPRILKDYPNPIIKKFFDELKTKL